MQDSSQTNGYKNHFATFSDANLDVFLKSGHTDVLMITAAAEELHRRKREREDALHGQLLAEIRKPHWSVTPSFCLLVVSVILTAAALIVAFVGLPQEKQSLPIVAPAPVSIEKDQTKLHSPSPHQSDAAKG